MAVLSGQEVKSNRGDDSYELSTMNYDRDRLIQNSLSLSLTTVAITANHYNMSQSPFQKFVPKKKNSVIKEEFRQEKKKYRKERNAFFEKKNSFHCGSR